MKEISACGSLFRVDTRDREETFPWAREVESRSLDQKSLVFLLQTRSTTQSKRYNSYAIISLECISLRDIHSYIRVYYVVIHSRVLRSNTLRIQRSYILIIREQRSYSLEIAQLSLNKRAELVSALPKELEACLRA